MTHQVQKEDIYNQPPYSAKEYEILSKLIRLREKGIF